jgi:large conductance mechanosensitive channel
LKSGCGGADRPSGTALHECALPARVGAAAAGREAGADMSIVSEFKAFAMRGNVVDLAVAVVIGAAFGKIVSALVDGVIMPVVGLLVGGVHFGDLAWVLRAAPADGEGEPVLLRYGAFLQSVLDFVIVAFAIFLVVKLMNRLKRKEAAAPEAVPIPAPEVVLLSEIRDLLKQPR